jgi:hypothetical protein
LFLRIKTLEWATNDHLEINPNHRVDEMWQLAADSINIIDFKKSSPEKL